MSLQNYGFTKIAKEANATNLNRGLSEVADYRFSTDGTAWRQYEKHSTIFS